MWIETHLAQWFNIFGQCVTGNSGRTGSICEYIRHALILDKPLEKPPLSPPMWPAEEDSAETAISLHADFCDSLSSATEFFSWKGQSRQGSGAYQTPVPNLGDWRQQNIATIMLYVIFTFTLKSTWSLLDYLLFILWQVHICIQCPLILQEYWMKEVSLRKPWAIWF